MIKTSLLASCLFFIFILSAFSQDQEKPSFRRNQIGIQLNPIFDEQFFTFIGYMRTVAALRYGNRITRNVTAGLEFGCSFPIDINSGRNFQYYNHYSYQVGLYSRYSIFSQKRFQLFAEASPYYAHYRGEMMSSFDLTPYKVGKFGYYVAPGMTLYSKKRRISFDLYYKFSNLMFMNGNKSVVSYKINYNF